MLSKQLVYDGFTDKYTITQILGNAAAHAHYHPCNGYQAFFPPSVVKGKNRPGDEANTLGT